MRILFVTHGIPLPPCGGHLLRAYHQMRQLATAHQVDLIALADPSRRNAAGQYDIESYRASLKEFCSQVEIVPAPARTRLTKAINYLSIYPSTATQIAKSQMPAAVAKQLSQTKYDAVIFLLSDIGICLPSHYEGCAILDMVDLFSVSFKYYSDICVTWSEKLRRRLDSLRYENYERFISKRFDTVLLVAKADIEQYAPITRQFDAHVDWVPHGISTANFVQPEHGRRKENTILISGDLKHPANVKGVEYFCNEVFPRVLQHLPQATLTIVGSKPTPAIERLASPSIKIEANVPDIKPYLFNAKVSFCGVQLRMGTQTKILEAMASGLPVVSTTAGNNGIEGINGKHLFYSDDPAELANAVVQLCTNEALWRSMSDSAKAYVSTRFSWENCVNRLTRIINETCQTSSPTLPPR